MDTLNIRFVFDRKNQANETDKQGLLQIEVRETGTSNKVFFSTGIKLYKKQFFKKKGEIGKIRDHTNSSALNRKALRIYRDIEAFILSDKCKRLEDVKKWDTKEESTLSVISFIYDELRRKNPSSSVLAQNNSLIKRLEEFGKFKTFSDFTYSNIIDFDTHLKDSGIAEPTAYKRHSMLHGYIREAINRGYCTYDPYITFRPKKGKSTDPVYLDEFELEALKNYDLSEETESDSLTKVKDLFVFQCFTGLAYIDVFKLKKQDIITRADGEQFIIKDRNKTGNESHIPLLEIPQMILKKYEDANLSNEQLLPMRACQNMNIYIKEIAALCGINKNLFTHIARHTFDIPLVLNYQFKYQCFKPPLGFNG